MAASRIWSCPQRQLARGPALSCSCSRSPTCFVLQRVILFMGTPVFGGIMLFPFFYWLKVRFELATVPFFCSIFDP